MPREISSRRGWVDHFPSLAAVLALALIPVPLVAQDQKTAPAPRPAAEPDELAAQDKPQNRPQLELGEGRLISIRLPLTGNAHNHLKTTIQRVVGQLARLPRVADRRPILILEIVPQRRHAGHGEGTSFEAAGALARFLTSPALATVKTVAYIPRTIKGHGVLIALACEEIVMHPDAEIGEAGIDEKDQRGIEPVVMSLYQQIQSARQTVPRALALGMLDPRLEVLKVETDQGTEFILADELDALKQNHTIISQETLVPAGAMGIFSGREGRNNYGFVKLLASDRKALAHGLSLAPQAVVEDQSFVGDWREVMLHLDGPITPRKVRQLETLIGTEVRDRKVNWLGITIDSAGGELRDCIRLADVLAALDANEVQTVAYVPVEASGGAALAALACRQLVMHPEAHLGGKGTVDFDRQTLDAATISVRDSLAKNSDRDWSLLMATIDPDLELFSYHNKRTGEIRYFSDEEAQELPNPADWTKGPRIKPLGEPWRLSAERAQELDLANHVVASFDEFKQLYGFDHDPRLSEPNWALELVEALSSPALAVVLLVIGFVGIYVELHTPGIGAGAFVAALAFLLFFWSNYLDGNVGWLEVLLFLGGIFFLLVEMLLLPGFGIFGLGGALMVLASLVLASQTFVLPTKTEELAELRQSLTIVAAAAALVVACSIALRHYLPQAPVFRTLLLNPPPEEELIDLDHREVLADFSHLLGRHGTAATNLMPAGKADFDGQLVDVIAEGLPIERGTPIVVVKARANRVIVRPAPNG